MITLLMLLGLVASLHSPLPPNHMLTIALLGKDQVAPKANSFGEPGWCDDYNPLALDPRY